MVWPDITNTWRDPRVHATNLRHRLLLAGALLIEPWLDDPVPKVPKSIQSLKVLQKRKQKAAWSFLPYIRVTTWCLSDPPPVDPVDLIDRPVASCHGFPGSLVGLRPCHIPLAPFGVCGKHLNGVTKHDHPDRYDQNQLGRRTARPPARLSSVENHHRPQVTWLKSNLTTRASSYLLATGLVVSSF